MVRLVYLLLGIVLLGGCATTGNITSLTHEQVDWLLSGRALDGVEIDWQDLPEERILYLNPEMRRYAEHAVDGYEGRDRVTALVSALIGSSGLALSYDAHATYTAEEVFEHGRANCLSFTNLFIAMARYVDMDAQYNEVDVPPIWDMRSNNTLVLNKHINAMVTRQQRFRHVIDLNAEEYEQHYEQRNIDDSLALAQHYNNKAMGYLMDSDYSEALRYMVKAIEIEPGISFLWNNLGSLYRRAGNRQAAELSYIAAIDSNEDDLVAMSNMARLYRDSGKIELALYYEEKAEAYRMQNPYFLYNIAQKAFIQRDYDSALAHIDDAIGRYDKEHRFFFLKGAILERTGSNQEAYTHFNKALELSSNHAQQARYRRKMDRLNDSNS